MSYNDIFEMSCTFYSLCGVKQTFTIGGLTYEAFNEQTRFGMHNIPPQRIRVFGHGRF